jgi:hypothetical protein
LGSLREKPGGSALLLGACSITRCLGGAGNGHLSP